MRITTKDGSFTVSEVTDDPTMVVVQTTERAAAEAILDAVGGEVVVVDDPTTDTTFELRLTKVQWVDYAATDHSNFDFDDVSPFWSTPEGRAFLEAAASTPTDGLTKRDRLLGALMGAAIGDALSATTEGCLHYFVHAGPEGVTGFTDEARMTSRSELLLFATASIIQGSIRAAAKGIAAPPEDYVAMGYQRWLHIQGLPWSTIDLDADHRYGCWLMEEAVLFNEGGHFGYGMGGEMTHRAFYEDGTPRREILASSICEPMVAPAALALVEHRNLRGQELFDATLSIATMFTSEEEEEAQTSALFGLVLGGLLEGRSLDDVVAEINGTLNSEAVLVIDRLLGLLEEEDATGQEWAPWSAKGSLSVALAAARSDEEPVSTLLEVINVAREDSEAGIFYAMLVGAMYGIEAFDPQWIEQLAGTEVITELADDLATWTTASDVSFDGASVEPALEELWTKYEGTQFIPGASQLWEIDLSTPGAPTLATWQEPGQPRRGIGDDAARSFSADAVGVVYLPMGDGLAQDAGVRLFRDEDDRLFLYVSPFGSHPGLDYVTEVVQNMVGRSGCGDARSFLTWCMESDGAWRVFGGMSAFGTMGTFGEIEGGYDVVLQDDLGFLGLRADGGRPDENFNERWM